MCGQIHIGTAGIEFQVVRSQATCMQELTQKTQAETYVQQALTPNTLRLHPPIARVAC